MGINNKSVIFKNSDYFENSKSDFMINKKLEVMEFKNAVILPIKRKKGLLFGCGGVTCDEEYLSISAQLGYNMMDRVNGAYEVKNENIEHVNKTVVYINYFRKHWGHFLMDVVGRLWYALDSDKDTLFVYTVDSEGENEISGNYLEFLELLGIERNQLVKINRPTSFDKVVIPESSIYPGKYYTQEYREIFKRVTYQAIKKIKDSGIPKFLDVKKVYCSRSNFAPAKRRENGEHFIEEVFNNNGYSSVYMETLTLTQQIYILNNADSVAALSGSLPHNLLFVQQHNNFIILNKTYLFNLHQSMINQITSAVIKEVDVFVAPMPVTYGQGPFIIRITNDFVDFCAVNDIACEYEPNERLKFTEKLRYYFNWIWINKKFVLKNGFRIDKFDNDVDYSCLRKFYADSQKVK